MGRKIYLSFGLNKFMTYQNKISVAKSRLLLSYPYFGSLAMQLDLKENNSIETFQSDGLSLEYNQAFILNSSLEEIEFILANGAMHKTLLHQNRKANRTSSLWQLATDFAINDMLIQNNLTPPDNIHYKKEFQNMYAEEIYTLLNKENKQENTAQKRKKQISQQEILKEQLIEQQNITLLETNKNQGNLPNGIERFFQINYNSKIPWQEILKNTINKYYRDDFTLIKPNKKYISQNIYLPSISSQTLKFIIAIDTSASIDQTLLNQFLSEINIIFKTLAKYKIELIICDEVVREHYTIEPSQNIEISHLTGGAATDFRPVFSFIEKEFYDVELLIYFSDLQGTFPDKAPSYEVLWITPKQQSIPFGTLVLL